MLLNLGKTIKYDHNLKIFKVVFVLTSNCQSFPGGFVFPFSLTWGVIFELSLLNHNASVQAMRERRRPRAYPAPTCVPLPHHCHSNFTTTILVSWKPPDYFSQVLLYNQHRTPLYMHYCHEWRGGTWFYFATEDIIKSESVWWNKIRYINIAI